ncbi:TonB-dependent receptor [Gammaproteobacteria bacterium LSUCC0112]|nr:TonB-dependent receptor [Gammaproteobacteria bacterium LSUCC0112]
MSQSITESLNPSEKNQGQQKRKVVRLHPLAYAVILASCAPSLYAQSQPDIEEIIVRSTATGTGIRGIAPVGSPSISISREELLESPVRNAAEIITEMPQGSQLNSGIANASGGNGGGARGLNLRGLGTNASLLLINGHRPVGQGISTVAPDPGAIPFAAIERVEAVMDGVSSVYGSDAVAGVVNFILRNDFEGVDVKLSGQSGLQDGRQIDIVAGKNFANANVMFGLTEERMDAMNTNERGYLMQDLRPYGGADNRLTTPYAGTPGTIVLRNRTMFGIPSSFTGVTDPATGLKRPTLAEVNALRGQPNLADSGDYTTYRGEEDNTKAFARVRVDLNDTLQLTYTGLLGVRTTRNEGNTSLALNITPNSPYYIPGLATAGQSYTIRYNVADSGVPWPITTSETTINQFVDAEQDIGEWLLRGSFFSGSTDGDDINRPEANNAALTTDPAGTPAGYKNYAEFGNNPEWFNPYLATPQAGLAEHLIGTTIRMGEQKQRGTRVGLEGPIWDLPGGTARLNVGAEYVWSTHWNKLNQDVRFYDKTNYVLRDTRINREVKSVYGEVYIPVVDTANAMPWMQKLVLNISARHDDYSDFGKTTNPRIGLSWDMNETVSLRASAGTAFRAPSLDQINPGVNSTLTRGTIQVNSALTGEFPLTIPSTGTTDIFVRGGRNPDLGPEEADMWSAGIDLTPQMFDGFRSSITYYNVKYQDRIENVPNASSALNSVANRQLYAPYITPITQPAGCTDGVLNTYHPLFQKFLNLEGTRFAGGPGDCDVVAIYDQGLQNVGSVNQSGVDVQASYNWMNDLGLWRVSGNVAKILELERTLIEGGAWFDVLDIIGWQTSLRSNVRLSWSGENWNAALTSKLEGGFTNNATPTVSGVKIPTQEVGSWATLDATVAYTAPENGSWMSGFNATLGVQNLTDKQPPIVLNGALAINPNVHNPFGRIWRLEVSKRFQ